MPQPSFLRSPQKAPQMYLQGQPFRDEGQPYRKMLLMRKVPESTDCGTHRRPEKNLVPSSSYGVAVGGVFGTPAARLSANCLAWTTNSVSISATLSNTACSIVSLNTSGRVIPGIYQNSSCNSITVSSA